MKTGPARTGRSRTNVSQKNRLILWVRAGGRCQYAGCNATLLGDLVSGAERLNKAFVAHIVAADPGGPRGDPVRSYALADSLKNLMLLCHAHHHLVDEEDEAGHPEARLLEMKTAHEARIEMLAGVRSLGVLPDAVIAAADTLDTATLAVAMAALGLTTRLSSMKAAGLAPLGLGAALFAWLVVGGGAINLAVHALWPAA